MIPLVAESGSCPAGDKCPFTIPIQGQIKYLKEQIAEREFKAKSEKELFDLWEIKGKTIVIPSSTDRVSDYDKLQSYKQAIKDLSKAKELVIQYETLQQTVESIHNRSLNLNNQKLELNKELITIDTDIKIKRDLLEAIDVNKLNIALSTVRIHIQELRKKIEEYAIGTAMAVKARDAISIDCTKVDAIKALIDKGQEEVSRAYLLKTALGSSGIKAVVIDYLVPQLEDRINTVLGQMSDFKIRLDTQRAKMDDEGVTEGLFITVVNDRKEELSFDNYSGGEKVKITIAISEALASLMNQIGFRIMDENIVSLDKESTEGFVEVLTKLQDKFPQLIVISHLQEVKDMFENKVEIIKVNGVSQIK